MSDRERWIVYPLLFLALLQSQRDAFKASYDVAEFQSIQCNAIEIQSPNGERKVRIVGNPDSGVINVYGSGPQRCITLTTRDRGKAGQLELIHSSKYSGVKLTANPDGGVAELSGARTAPAMRIGVDPVTKTVGVSPSNGHLIPIQVELTENGLNFVADFPPKKETEKDTQQLDQQQPENSEEANSEDETKNSADDSSTSGDEDASHVESDDAS